MSEKAKAIRELAKMQDQESGIYINGSKVNNPVKLVGKTFIIDRVEQWYSIRCDLQLFKINLTQDELE